MHFHSPPRVGLVGIEENVGELGVLDDDVVFFGSLVLVQTEQRLGPPHTVHRLGIADIRREGAGWIGYFGL